MTYPPATPAAQYPATLPRATRLNEGDTPPVTTTTPAPVAPAQPDQPAPVVAPAQPATPAAEPAPAQPATPAAELPTCRGLALSGYGSRAAYQAGAIDGMLKNEGMDFSWDVVTGIGSGALNAAILSMYSVD